ncbi:MAG: radical SAM protein [Candidatus Coatesbacteria bacterium]|nr:MAG: radical SAM protein [Candidatus Coatesbacteria bacterium]
MARAAVYDAAAPGDNPDRASDRCGYGGPLLPARELHLRFRPENYIFRAKLPSGGCAPVLKVLMTNVCENNCAYCAHRQDRDIPRDTISPEELARALDELVRRGAVGGAFISSGDAGGAARTMDRIIAAAELIRRRGFVGYLHLKIMPGSEEEQIRRAMELATRVSVNLEAPTAEHLGRIAPDKRFEDGIMSSVKTVAKLISRGVRPPAGHTTQFVVGAAGESDVELLTAADGLYRIDGMRRAYYSGFAPVANTPLEYLRPTPVRREGRLYQADWLLRMYGFSLDELPFGTDGALPQDVNPKLAWARARPNLFPIEVNTADRGELLRVPGVGPIIAKRIIETRRAGKIREPATLLRLGARPLALEYVTLDGAYRPVGEATSGQLELGFGTP